MRPEIVISAIAWAWSHGALAGETAPLWTCDASAFAVSVGHHGDTTRDRTQAFGAGLTLTNRKWGVIDAGLDRVRSEFLPSSNIDDVYELGGTLGVGRFLGPYWVRIGGHLIRTDRQEITTGSVLAGAHRWWDRFHIGLDTSFTHVAPDLLPWRRAWQVDLTTGVAVFVRQHWRLDLTAIGTGIFIDDDSAREADWLYSGSAGVHLGFWQMALAVDGWIGQRRHQVAVGGYAVHDEGERYLRGLEGSIGWYPATWFRGTIAISREIYVQEPRSGRANADRVLVTLGSSF